MITKDFYLRDIEVGDRCIRYTGFTAGLEEVIVLGYDEKKGVKILNNFDKEVYTQGSKLFDLSAFERQIRSENVQPVRRGKWDGYICSECNVCADYFISGDFYFDEKPDYCPNCGARMDSEQNDHKQYTSPLEELRYYRNLLNNLLNGDEQEESHGSS